MERLIEMQIASCEGVYRAADVARHFGVRHETVARIWNSDDAYDEVEPPNIWGCKPTAELSAWDAYLLHQRGLTCYEIGVELGVSPMTACNWIRRYL